MTLLQDDIREARAAGIKEYKKESDFRYVGSAGVILHCLYRDDDPSDSGRVDGWLGEPHWCDQGDVTIKRMVEWIAAHEEIEPSEVADATWKYAYSIEGEIDGADSFAQWINRLDSDSEWDCLGYIDCRDYWSFDVRPAHVRRRAASRVEPEPKPEIGIEDLYQRALAAGGAKTGSHIALRTETLFASDGSPESVEVRCEDFGPSVYPWDAEIMPHENHRRAAQQYIMQDDGSGVVAVIRNEPMRFGGCRYWAFDFVEIAMLGDGTHTAWTNQAISRASSFASKAERDAAQRALIDVGKLLGGYDAPRSGVAAAAIGMYSAALGWQRQPFDVVE